MAVTHATPLITSNGIVVTLDPRCNLLGFQLPAAASSFVGDQHRLFLAGSSSQPWEPLFNYSDSSVSLDAFDPCTQLILDEGDIVYYGDRVNHKIYGIDVSQAPPRPLNWSPLQLPMDQDYQALVHHSLIHSAGLLLMPLRYLFGSLVLHTASGNASRLILTTTSPTPPVLAGSVGLPAFSPGNEDGGASMFTVYVPPDGGSYDIPTLLAINSTAQTPWMNIPGKHHTKVNGGPSKSSSSTSRSNNSGANSIDFLGATSRDNPVLVPMYSSSLEQADDAYCILLLQQSIGSSIPAKLFAIEASTGKPCLQWSAEGYAFPANVSSLPALVGTPAAISYTTSSSSTRVAQQQPQPQPQQPPDAFSPSDFTGTTIVYYVAGTSLLQLILQENGYLLNATSNTLGVEGSDAVQVPPVIFEHGWGLNQHVVVSATNDGKINCYDAKDIAKGPVYTYDLPDMASILHSSSVEYDDEEEGQEEVQVIADGYSSLAYFDADHDRNKKNTCKYNSKQYQEKLQQQTKETFLGKPIVVGPFMAATNTGDLIFMVRDSGAISEEYSAFALVAIVPVILPPAAAPPPPPPPPPPEEEKHPGRTAFLIIFFIALIAGVAFGGRKWYMRRAARRREMEQRNWYTSMAGFDDETSVRL